MTEKYNYYYDEIYHDKVLRIKENGFNFQLPNASDSFVGLFWGVERKEVHILNQELLVFEKKQKKIWGVGENNELKSSVLRNEFKYGVESFSEKAISFYDELFELLLKYDCQIQITILSKTDIYASSIIGGLDFECVEQFSKKRLIYDLAKFIISNDVKLPKGEMSHEERLTNLINQITTVVEKNKNVEWRFNENKVMHNVLALLKKSKPKRDINIDISFPYYAVFAGFDKYLDALSISKKNIKVVIDNEENTLNEAKLHYYGTLKASDSKDNILIRVSDWLAGFVGRLIYSFQNDENHLGKKETCSYSMKIVSETWFEFKEKQFDLYRKAWNYFSKANTFDWGITVSGYGDAAFSFIGLLGYISSFGSYEDYCSIPCENHSSAVNKEIAKMLDKHFENMVD